MSILGKLFAGGVGQVAQPVEAVGNVLDKLFTSDDERLDRAEALQRLAQQPQLAQTEINKLEAQHRSVFVAGWRPAVGWICALAMGYQYVLRDLLAWALAVWAPAITPPPALALDAMMTVLMGLLGLGAMRTVEKMGGRSK